MANYSESYLRLVREDLVDWERTAVDPRRKDTLQVAILVMDEKIKALRESAPVFDKTRNGPEWLRRFGL